MDTLIRFAMVACLAGGCGTVNGDGQEGEGGTADAAAGTADAATGTADSGPEVDAAPPAARCAHMAPFESLDPVGGVNTASSERNAWLSPDERTIVFTRIPAGGSAKFYIASRSDVGGAFDTPTPLDELDSGDKEYRATLSSDLKTVYFDRQPAAGGAFDILMGTRSSLAAQFTGIAPVANVNGVGTSDYEPMVGQAGMYLVSNRDSEIDLYLAPAVGAGFGQPQPLAAVNSDSQETEPVASPDGSALYFAAFERPPDGASWDVWLATGTGADLATPVRLGSDINGAGDEIPSWLSRDRCRLYFWSDAGGDYDIWVATRSPRQ